MMQIKYQILCFIIVLISANNKRSIKLGDYASHTYLMKNHKIITKQKWFPKLF